MRRLRTYHEPYRTSGVTLFNLIGRRLRHWGWKRRLNVPDIVDLACRFTGLNDFGDERFREPLQIVVEALEEEAQLHPFGRLMLKMTLAHFAANLLRVRQYVRVHPEALAEQIAQPLYVIGLPRTGTTLLYNLLGQDPCRRSLRLWEALQPAPRNTADGKRDRRVAVARLAVTSLNYWLAPQLRTVHPLHAAGPEEDTSLLCNTFVCPAFLLYGYVPRYVEWMLGRGREMLPWVYEQYRTYLQVLQHQGRRARWVLKSPAHAFGLEALLAVFPDACIVETHRDLRNVVPSTCSLFAIMQGIYSDDVDRHRLGAEILRLLHLLQDRSATGQLANPSRFYHVPYPQLVADPRGTVSAIYRHFGLEMEEGMQQRMRNWLARNPANKHGVHHYDLQQFGLTPQDLESA